jgi:hypothetical protein
LTVLPRMLRLMDVFPMLLRVLTISATSSTAWGMSFLMVHNLGSTKASMISSFNDQEIVALSGAHALGRCHTNRYVLFSPYVVLTPIIFPLLSLILLKSSSGFEGPWTFSPTTMTNDYFTLLANEKWQWRKWNGPKQYEDSKTKVRGRIVPFFQHP